MKDTNLIETYSKIVYNKSIAIKSLDKVIADVKTIVEIIEFSPHLIRFFTAPIYELEDKLAVIEALDKKIKMEKLSRNFVETLLRNNRIMYIRDIYERLVELELLSKNITSATLTSARPMSASDIEKCQGMLEKKLGKKFAIKHIIDSSIIGGVMLKFGSNLYDISVAGAEKYLSREINEA
jgi:F-type H+-transporting ATPase subunit delta